MLTCIHASICTFLHAYMLSSLAYLVCLGWHRFEAIVISLASYERKVDHYDDTNDDDDDDEYANIFTLETQINAGAHRV